MTAFDDLEIEVGKLTLGADDVVVLRANRSITSVAGAEVRAHVHRLLGSKVRVLIFDPDIEIATLKLSPEAAVVLRVRSPIDETQRGRVEAWAKRSLGDATRVLVIDGAMEASIRPGAATPKPREDAKAKEPLRMPLTAPAR